MMDNQLSLFEQGIRSFEMGEYDEAEKCFKAVIEIDPKQAEAWNKLGVTYVYQKNLPEAEECFKTAVFHNPKLAVAYSNLGNIYFEQERYEEAIAVYHRAIEADPEYGNAYHNLGVLYKQQGNIAEGIKYLKKGAKLNNRRPWKDAEPPKLANMRMLLWVIIAFLIFLIFRSR